MFSRSFSRRTLIAGCCAAGARATSTSRLETLSDWLRASINSRKAALSSCLERIRSEDKSIQAWVQVRPQRPTGIGTLDEIPFGAKDIIETRTLATEYGSPVYKGRIGTADAAIIRELRGLGAILIGKTHTAAFAMRDPPPTRNPRAPKHTPGGSSSGSAAAVAAGMVPFAIGTQTGGSVIRPASYCGVTGFKTSFAVFSLDGVLPYARSLDTLGFFTHTPADMLLLWKALGRDTVLEQELAVGVPEPIPDVEPPMAAAFHKALRSLREAGVRLQRVDVSALLASLVGPHRTIMYFEGARFHQQRVAEFGDRLGYLATLVREGLRITEGQYSEAKTFVGECRVRINQLYKAVPVIAVPAATGPAPPGITFTGDARMNTPWTALGTPALSIPLPVAAGLPLGLQLTAAAGQDAHLLQAAIRVHRIVTGTM